ncbi:Hypothetical predicted protein, partial [Paramuricea clavata]
NDLKIFASDHIQRLRNSPRQNGTNSILLFYATLPSGNGTVPRSILATIFVKQQERIFSVDSLLENSKESVASGERQVLTLAQNLNTVPIALINFPVAKFTSLEELDIKVEKETRCEEFFPQFSGEGMYGVAPEKSDVTM